MGGLTKFSPDGGNPLVPPGKNPESLGTLFHGKRDTQHTHVSRLGYQKMKNQKRGSKIDMLLSYL